MGSPPEERQLSRLEVLLDELCQDSLEVPLSHVDDPTCTGDITDRYREARALVRGAEAAIERKNEKLRQIQARTKPGSLVHDLASAALSEGDSTE